MLTRHQRIIAAALVTLTACALAAMLLTRSWASPRDRLRAMGSLARRSGTAVDTRPLDAAQQLAQLAETRSEKSYAEEALRLSDYSVDFAFAAAIRAAAITPAPATPAALEVMARLKTATVAVDADSARVMALARQINGASGASRDGAQQQLDLAQAQLELDRDDAEDAHQDLVRAGGDRIVSLQKLRDQHDSSLHATRAPAAAAAVAAAPAPISIELTKTSNVLDQVAAWRSLHAKRALLNQTRQAAVDREARFSQQHDSLEKHVAAEKAAASGSGKALLALQALAADQKELSALDNRIDNEHDLAATYASWITYVELRQQSFLHGIFTALFWMLLIALLVFGANEGAQRIFSDVAESHRSLHTVRTITLFGVQAVGILLILLVLFGMPNNFATVIALAGAGLALALQDFILGFFGWFVLMGKDGMRPGDWVEINGVGGEVLEVGVFQTVLLETSNWSESAHPTGRKVSFVNSFAIEGHYFNFSTSGQWLWDEIEVTIPDGTDPYAIAEEIQRLASGETAANADVAEQEWRRVVPARVRQTFTAEPSVSVRPTVGGVTVLLRYLTRASDRQAVRAKMNRAVIELLHGNVVPATPRALQG